MLKAANKPSRRETVAPQDAQPAGPEANLGIEDHRAKGNDGAIPF